MMHFFWPCGCGLMGSWMPPEGPENARKVLTDQKEEQGVVLRGKREAFTVSTVGRASKNAARAETFSLGQGLLLMLLQSRHAMSFWLLPGPMSCNSCTPNPAASVVTLHVYPSPTCCFSRVNTPVEGLLTS